LLLEFEVTVMEEAGFCETLTNELSRKVGALLLEI